MLVELHAAASLPELINTQTDRPRPEHGSKERQGVGVAIDDSDDRAVSLGFRNEPFEHRCGARSGMLGTKPAGMPPSAVEQVGTGGIHHICEHPSRLQFPARRKRHRNHHPASEYGGDVAFLVVVRMIPVIDEAVAAYSLPGRYSDFDAPEGGLRRAIEWVYAEQ